MSEPAALGESPFVLFTSYAEKDAAEASGQYAPGVVFAVLDRGQYVEAGWVCADGTFCTGNHFTAAVLGRANLTLTAGVGDRVTQDATGLELVANAGSTDTAVKLPDFSAVGPSTILATIQLTSIVGVVNGMLALVGWHNDAGTDDWIAGGWRRDAAQWRLTMYGHDYNGGAPVETPRTIASDMSAYIAESTFFTQLIQRTTDPCFLNSSLKSGGVIRATPGTLLLTATNTMAVGDTMRPFFFVRAPSGSLTAKLIDLKIIPTTWTGYW